METDGLADDPHGTAAHGLSGAEIRRYGRQLILDGVGPAAQARLSAGRVLVVGAGGLGAPVLQYLAAAGVGTIGVVDGDDVAVDNLHRQVVHGEASVGTNKAVSAAAAVAALNSLVRCVAHPHRLTPENAVALARRYDVLVDCTDNAPTRYLVNDAAVIAGRPVVSGSALRLEGQVTVYAHLGGPCYRCLFPRPPPAETVVNCSDGGVLGAVTGVVGSLQALEVLKIVGGVGSPDQTLRQRLLVYDGLSCRFMTVKLRPRSPECAACGDAPTVREPLDGVAGYEHFCGGAPAHDGAVAVAAGGAGAAGVPAVACAEYAAEAGGPAPPVLLDVRAPVQFAICSLPGAVNVPLRELPRRMDEVRALAGAGGRVVTVCRRGVDSRAAARLLLDAGVDARDLAGGLVRWAADHDPTFPIY